jgi:putative membrane protein
MRRKTQRWAASNFAIRYLLFGSEPQASCPALRTSFFSVLKPSDVTTNQPLTPKLSTMKPLPLFRMIPNHFCLFSIAPSRFYSCAVSSLVLLLSASTSYADDTFPAADKAFVAKVSQGGMFEVELAKVAETKATTQDLRDQANTEEHDHTLVGNKLKSIMETNGMQFPTALNAEFQARLDKLSALSGAAFDSAYLHAMQEIHHIDGAAFKQESTGGSNPDLKAFAAETHRIVLRHLGELGATVN